MTSIMVLLQISPAMAIVKPSNADACTHITTLQSTNEAEMATHIAIMQTNFATRLAKITTDQAAVDQKVATARVNAHNQFEEKIKSMESQTGLTDTQKQAIETYKTDMNQAETTRETAIDKARTTYRTNLSNSALANQRTLTNAVNVYKTAVQSAFATASTNCGDGTALTTLKASIKTARETLTTTRTATKTTNEIKQYTTTRNDAIKAANKVFTDSVAQYTTTLTSALKRIPR